MNQRTHLEKEKQMTNVPVSFKYEKVKKLTSETYLEREKQMSGRPAVGREYDYVREVLQSGKLSSLCGGTYTAKFEQKFADMMGSKYAVAMHSCMSALHAAMITVGATAGSEVICDCEFIFGAMAVLYNNAVPVFIDIDPVTHNMDAAKIEAAVSERTKAIIVTHAWGLPAEMDRIMAIAKKHNLAVVEDCAEAINATYKGRYTGTWGDIGCFSFQASKQMSLGDGGMATTQNEAYCKELANHAGAPTFKSIAYNLDYNYRINEQTAAIGLARLENLDEAIAQFRKNAGYYDQAVKDCSWITLQRGPERADHSFYHWAATFTGDKDNGPSFEVFRDAVEQGGMGSVSIGYTRMPAYKHPLIVQRKAAAFTDERNKKCRMDYRDGLCPIAEKNVPRLILGYMVEPEDTAEQEAEKLYKIIRRWS